MRKFLVFTLATLAMVVGSQPAAAQQREISGTVTVAGTGQPLSDAIVGVVGSAGGARTNEQGQYRLRAPSGDVTIQVRAIGYKRAQLRVDANANTQNFSLEKDVLQLEGVTITGAATTIDRKNAATAISAVTAENIARVPAVSIENALQGKTVGVQFSMNNGAPGGGAQVQVRGASSLLGNIQPLFVVDGVIISNSVRATRQSVLTGQLNSGEENGTNRLADINPNDIESVEILKSAAASAIYGSQATNGVVVITTKRGSGGAPRFNLTQRVGTFTLMNNPGSRHWKNAQQVLDFYGGNADAVPVINANCTPNCPYYDMVDQLFGRSDPSYETVATLTGGFGSNSRYFVSANNKDEQGTAVNTYAKRQGIRANVDHSIGSKINLSVGTNILRSKGARGISNNDNTFSSPLYAFGYTPAITDWSRRQANGMIVDNPFPGGSIRTSSNPFQTYDLMKNDEDIWRMIFSGRGTYAAYASDKNNVNVTAIGGVDRYSNESYVYGPPTLQQLRLGTPQAGNFPGGVIQGNGTNRFMNGTLSAVWNNTSFSWMNATTQVGLQYEERALNDYNLIARGLGPQQVNANAQAQNLTAEQSRQLVRNQAYLAQEELLLFGEKLYLSAAVRAERSSVNGDPEKYFYFPRASASYRFVNPIQGVGEFKVRASYGKAGNQPQYGERFLVLASGGQIGGATSVVQSTVVNNPDAKPEVNNEVEVGFDASMWRDRLRVEATYFNRRITDLLVRPVPAPSTGVTSSIINGGEMQSKGYEIGLTAIPVQTDNLTWTSRSTWYQNRQDVTEFPPGVTPFGAPSGGGFGGAYGRLLFTQGYPVSMIFGNKKINGQTVGNSPLGDGNARYTMNFANDVQWNRLTLTTVADYKHGGYMSSLTLNLYDEGGNTWDYDDPSPDPAIGATKGEWRYNAWGGGSDATYYVQKASFAKLREVALSYDMPQGWFSKIPGARSGRLTFSGRNLFMITPFNGFDPEVNNGGSVVARVVDLAPFPPTRSFFLSVDLGW
ncbi:MAG: SusC/RagA family TonB-linked outer membrane protein [Gemmatimonadaceae bacterium]|nr:SusC/RagA family TonB-linked outer membrane protein [Gemmatimonadaceae bacterium]